MNGVADRTASDSGIEVTPNESLTLLDEVYQSPSA